MGLPSNSNTVRVKGRAYKVPSITVDWLLARVKAHPDEEECLVWQGFIDRHGLPICRITLAPRVAKTMLVRRLVWRMMNGKHPKDGTWITTSCETHGCVSPEHVVSKPMPEIQRVARAVTSEQHKAKIARSRRKKSAVSDEQVREMLVSDETSVAIGERLGVNSTYASQVRRGTLRRDYSNPLFSGLISNGQAR